MMRADKVKSYRPTDKEPFMNERQRDYFRQKLLAWKEDILKEAKETLQHLQDENQNHPDLADRASSETDRAIELRARDRQRKLIAKIDAALSRIEDGTYGYCEETGEPISIKRLEARPCWDRFSRRQRKRSVLALKRHVTAQRRIEAHRSRNIAERIVRVAKPSEGRTTEEIGPSQRWIKLDRSGRVAHGTFVVMLT